MSGMTKSERLQEMKRLYIQRAYSDIEMAERLNVNRTTIYRDRMELTTEYPIEPDDEGRYRIARSKLISEIKVNLNEALSLYLAARKASRQTRFHQPHAASALEKLAATLRQPMTERLLKAADVLLKQEKDPERVKILEILAQAWVEEKKVRIRYRRLGSDEFVNHTISPYLIEPSIWSDSIYVIALSDVTEKLIAFRIDRIDTAVLSGEEFEIPADFDDQQLLKHAWGIWYGDKEPVNVKLRFFPTVTRRVKESIWHPLEKVTDTEDGGCLWSADVAEWREMLPWVRGWGADVEVLEPEGLRNALKQEAQELVRLYKLIETQKIQYYAHSKEGLDKTEWQLLKEHLDNTSVLAVELGRDAGISELARVAALLHDVGKYSQAFQKRLEGSNHKVDHATAGAREARNLFSQDQNQKSLATILAYCIAGHHNGLPDYGSAIDMENDGTLLARRDKKKLEDYSAYKIEIDLANLTLPARLSIRPLVKHEGFSLAFLTRMLYSTLVDADWLETETYMSSSAKPRGGYSSIESLCQIFNQYLQKYDNPKNVINQKRTETLKACIEKSSEKQGFFTLTVPTGGGKTLASMAFALNHAVAHGLKRIIYVIPFTSIIEQNAAVFKDCLGEENILEHHSNFDWEQLKRRVGEESTDDETNKAYDKLKLASENWDIPIVVTTNVQFFESLFASRKSRARKLHNIARSVIIFDEAQMLPREYLDPCMLAVKELVQNYGASAVFCTATQPSLNRFLPGTEFTELAPNPQALFNFYKRVQIKNIGKVPDAELLEKMNTHGQALCIVNTRKHAKGLFDGLLSEGRFHLSTLMCPTHRKETLIKIRDLLKSSQPCHVVSTQVMEAGIDVDFPVGYRSLAGLDSIIQAAGRVNREGKNANGDMYVFDPVTPFIKKTPIFIKQGASVAESILRDFSDDPMSIQAINAYFKTLYNLQDPKRAFDVKRILSYFDKGTGELDFDFKTAADNFNLIENNTVAVVIPYNDDAKKLLEQARYHPFPFKFARQLQIYTVNIYQNEFEALQSKGVIETYNETYEVLNNMDYYDKQTGIILPADKGGEALFFE